MHFIQPSILWIIGWGQCFKLQGSNSCTLQDICMIFLYQHLTFFLHMNLPQVMKQELEKLSCQPLLHSTTGLLRFFIFGFIICCFCLQKVLCCYQLDFCSLARLLECYYPPIKFDTFNMDQRHYNNIDSQALRKLGMLIIKIAKLLDG